MGDAPTGRPASEAEIAGGLTDDIADDLADDIAFATVAIARDPTRAGRRPIVALGVVAALVVGLGLLGPQPDGRPLLDLKALLPGPSPSSRASPHASHPEPTRAPGTPLPVLAIFDPAAPTDPIALDGRSRLFLDPTTGAVSELSREFEVGLYIGTGDGGTLCICRLTPWNAVGEVARMVAVDWDAQGREQSRRFLVEHLGLDLPPGVQSRATAGVAVDVALSPDRSAVVVGSAIREQDGWVYRAEAFAVATGAALWSHVLATRPTSAPSPGAAGSPPPDGAEPGTRRTIAEIIVRYAPSSDRVIVTIVDGFDSPEAIWHRSSWLVPITPGATGSAPVGGVGDPRLIDDRDVAPNSWCQGEGFATADRYVAVCTSWSPSGQVSTSVRVVDTDGALIHDVPITESGGDFSPALVDVDVGIVYLWDPIGHRIARLDATSGETEIAAFGLGSAVAAMGRAATIPLGERRTAWRTLLPSLWPTPVSLVGSRDGATLYAVGIDAIPEPFRGPIPKSTGIWVFDATTLELKTIFAPAATHDGVSMSADGRYLLATGLPGVDEEGRASDWGRSLSIYDAQRGRLVERLGDLAAHAGPVQTLAWPAPGE